VLLVGAASILFAAPAAGSDDSQIKSQINAVINEQMRITILPSGSQPGKVTPAGVQIVQDRITNALPSLMTGDFLTSQTQGYQTWLTMVQTDDRIGVHTEAGVDSISFGPCVKMGGSATISGSDQWHYKGYHFEAGKRVDESSHGTETFTAQLALQNGTWLVSAFTATPTNAWSDTTVPPAGVQPLTAATPWPTSPPKPTSGTNPLPGSPDGPPLP